MNNKFSLKNKTVIITGGGSGIGEAISWTLASQGAVVHILDNQLESALETVKHIKKNNFIGLAHECDVSNNLEVNQVILEICKTSNIEILINNAGIAHVGNIENCKEEDLDRLYNVNIKGVYNCSKAVIPIMKKNKNGLIINLASIASSVGISDRFAYSMTKGAVLTMTYSIAKDYVKDNNIRRSEEYIVKTTGSNSTLKLYLIQSIDRKLPLPDIAFAKGMSMDTLLSEAETIVYSGTKLNIDYWLDEVFDEDQQEELRHYFLDSETDDINVALNEFDGEFDEDEIRLYRLKFLSEVAN